MDLDGTGGRKKLGGAEEGKRNLFSIKGEMFSNMNSHIE